MRNGVHGGEQRKKNRERRQRYSFRAHLKRVREQKGLWKIAGSLTAAAIVGAVMFASCSADAITGPRKANALVASSTGLQSTESESEPGTEGKKFLVSETFPVEGEEPNRCYPADLVHFHGTATYATYSNPLDVFRQTTIFKYKFDGPGSTSGVEYHGNERYLEEIDARGITGEFKVYHRIRMIPEHTVPEFRFYMVSIIKLKGTPPVVTASFERSVIQCETPGGNVDP
jgi:hypothetical protein